MPDERLTRTEQSTGNTHTREGIISEDGGASAGWAIALLVLVTVVAGFWFLTQTSDKETGHHVTVVDGTANVNGNAARGTGNAIETSISE